MTELELEFRGWNGFEFFTSYTTSSSFICTCLWLYTELSTIIVTVRFYREIHRLLGEVHYVKNNIYLNISIEPLRPSTVDPDASPITNVRERGKSPSRTITHNLEK